MGLAVYVLALMLMHPGGADYAVLICCCSDEQASIPCI
jgi:hypothetical protein